MLNVPKISHISRKISQVSRFPAKSPDSRNKFVFLPKQPLLELSPPVQIHVLRYQNQMKSRKSNAKKDLLKYSVQCLQDPGQRKTVKKLFVLNLFTIFYDKYTDSFRTISHCDTYHSEARTTFDREIKFRRFFSALLILRPRSEWSNSVMENLMAFRPYKIIK